MRITTRSAAPKLGLALLLSAGLVLAAAPPATAAPLPMTVTGSRSGGGVTGFAPPEGAPFLLDAAYPTYAVLPTGWDELDATANLYRGETADGTELDLYCIEVRRVFGVNYFSEDWLTADVPNLGYVTRILTENYPNVPDTPAGYPFDADRITIIQSAIWYFTDGFVLLDGSTHRSAVEALVNQVLADGPLVAPGTSEDLILSLAAPTGSFDPGQAIGPFTVTSTVPSLPFTIDVSSGVISAAADGTGVIPAGSDVPVGTDFWVTPSAGASLSVTVSSENPVTSGLVFGSPDQLPQGAAQTLITAATTFDRAQATATVPINVLPATGQETTWIAAPAGVLFVLGVAMLVPVRRRRVQ